MVPLRHALPCRRIAAALVAVGLLGAAAGPATAAPAAALPDFSLTVSPTRYVVPAGQIGQTKIFDVTNRGRLSVNVVVQSSGFTSSRAGAMVLQPRAAYSAANWVTVSPNTFHLASLQRRKIAFKLTLPARPEPGDHQLALVFLVPAAKGGSNIKLNRGIGTPVYVTVPGPVTAAVHVSALRAPGFALHGPVTLGATVVDTGTVHQDFRGTGALTAKAGGRSVRFADFTVLRGTTRDVSVRWNPPFLCVCHVTVALPGPGGVSEKSVRIVVLPLDVLGYVLAGLVVAVAAAILLRRRYRAHIEAAARRL